MHAQHSHPFVPVTVDQDDASRIQVNSLLNPHADAAPLRKNMSSSALQQSLFPPLNRSFSFSDHKQPYSNSAIHRPLHASSAMAPEYAVSNRNGRYGKALWRQEDDSGALTPLTQSHAMFTGSRLDCLASLSDPPKVQIPSAVSHPSARQQLGAHPPTSAPLPYAYNAYGSHSGYGSGSSTAYPHANYDSSRWTEKKTDHQQPRATTSQPPQCLAEPHIFVPRQPIIGHSAMSTDRSSDFIRPLPRSVNSGPLSQSVYDGFFSQEPAVQIPAVAPNQLPPVPMTLSPRRSAALPLVRPMPRMTPPSITLPPMKSQIPTVTTTSSRSSNMDTHHLSLNIPETRVTYPLTSPQSPYKRPRVASIEDPKSALLLQPVKEPLRSDSINSNRSDVSSTPLSKTLLAVPVKNEDMCVADVAVAKSQWAASRRKSSPSSSASLTESPAATPEKEQQPLVEKTGTDAEGGAEPPREDERPLFDWQKLEVPESIWVEAQELYDKVKVMKKVQNRQPICKRHAIHAALMFILCRNNGYPRTFAEICSAGNVTKREIGMYYNLMKQVLGKEYTSTMRAKPSEFLQRWCTVLELPSWIAAAATRVYDRADEMAIVQGKCPISISAASLWLVIWSYNHRHALKSMAFDIPNDTPVSSTALPNIPNLRVSKHSIDCDQRDVCRAASVVIATLTSVFRLLAPHLQTLISDMLDVHL